MQIDYHNWPHQYQDIAIEVPGVKASLKHYQNASISSNTLFVHLHANETTAVQAGLKHIAQQGGTLVELAHQKTRELTITQDNIDFSIDPNRLFSAQGIGADLARNNAFSRKNQLIAAQCANVILQQIKQHNPSLIVALHNNDYYQDPSHPDNYSIASYLPEGSESLNTAQIHINSDQCPDDFLLTTNDKIYQAFCDLNINIVLLSPASVDDGSLSFYCSQQRIPYVNIEARHQHLEAQMQMLQQLTTVQAHLHPPLF